MSTHPSNPTTTPLREGAKVLPFPSRRAQASGSPPSINRDPRCFPYGLLIVERCMSGGANGFHWFANEAQAAHFLREGIWDWIVRDETSEWIRSLYVDALRSTSRIREDWIREVSAQQDDVLVVWHGTFEALTSGADAFGDGLLVDFQGLPGARPLQGDTQIQGFIDYLVSYHG